MTRQHLKTIAQLGRRRGRRQHGAFLVEGVRSVEAAVGAGAPLLDVLVTEAACDDPRVAALADRAAAPVHVLPARDLDRVGDARTSQGVVAVSRSVARDALPADPGPVLVVDGVQDPGNVGTLVRTAAWFGVGTVVTGPETADVEGPKAVRAAMGGLWDVALVRVDDLGPVLDALAASGVALWGADLDGVAVGEWDPTGTALVVGSEAHGLSAAVRPRLAGRVTVAGGGAGVESLNVAVASGILLHAWRAGTTVGPSA